MRLFELLAALPDFSTGAVRDMEISGVVSDSRRVRPGYLFVCIPGLHVDGHHYVRAAVAAGAVAVVVQKGCMSETGTQLPFIEVTSARATLARLVSRFCGDPGDKLKLVAVTGTNGKTSVAFMLRAIFEGAMYRCGLIGTVRCYSGDRELAGQVLSPLANMTTPDPEALYPMLAQMVKDGVQVVIMEATSHALALDKLDALHFDAAVFTNLTPEHLDFHGDMEHYFAAKAKLFGRSSLAILNRDDPYAKRMAERAQGEVRFCSARSAEADYFADNACGMGVDGVGFELLSRDVRMRVRCSVPGRFSVMNALEAAALALEWGISPAVIQGALSSMSGIDGRMERIKLPFGADFSVFVDYAHTPDAMENLLRSVREFCRKEQRIVTLFGCGGDRDASKRPVMGRIAASLSDFVIVTSDNSRTENREAIIADILGGMEEFENFTVIPDRRHAIETAVMRAKAGDILLLLGKGHETYEIDRTGRHPFVERDIVRAAYERRVAGQRESE